MQTRVRIAVLLFGLILLFIPCITNLTVLECFTLASFHISLITIIMWIRSLNFKSAYLVNEKSLSYFDFFTDKRCLPAIIISILSAFILYINIDKHYRVPSDEASLLSVSQSLYSDHQARQTNQSIFKGTSAQVLEYRVPNRTSLFSTMISIIHSIRGYKSQNPFLLNFFILIILLALIIKNQDSNYFISATVALLILSNPIVALGAISGHYDVFFTLIAFTIFYQIQNYRSDPSNKNFDALWMSLIILTVLRHEGFLYSIPVLIFLILQKGFKWKHATDSIYVFATPLFLTQLIWHLYIYSDLLKQVKKTEIALFSVANFCSNVSLIFKKIITFDSTVPFAHITIILGVSYVAIFLYKRLKLESVKDLRSNYIVFCSIMFAIYCIFFLSWFWGYPDDQASARFYLFPSVVISVFTALLFKRILRPVDGFLVAISIFIIYFPQALKNDFQEGRSLFHEHNFVSDYFNQLKNRRFNLVVKQPHKYVIYDYGAIGFSYANANYSLLKKDVDQGLVDNIYVLQRLNTGTLSVTDDTMLNKQFKLETLKIVKISKGRLIKISKIDI